MFNRRVIESRHESIRRSVLQVRRQSNKIRIVVDTEMDYKNYLQILKQDFESRLKDVPLALDIGLKGFDLLSVIGTGSFAEVVGMRIVRDQDGNTFATKTMRKECIIKHGKVVNVINEKKLLYAFRFPFVLWLAWSRKDHDNLYLGLPLLSGGELYNLHSKYGYFTEEHARFYAAQVCLGLEYLHYLRVVYRDLKLENLVIDKEGYIRIIDFGFAKRVEYRTMSLCGTPEYLAPEIITTTPYFSGPDWWTFGVLVYEMVNGETPFANDLLDLKVMYRRISKADYEMPRKFSESLKDLIKRILVVDITKRLGCLHAGADDIKHHEWFSTVNWLSYLKKEIEPPFVPNITDDLDTRHFLKQKNKGSRRRKEKYRSSYTEAFEEF